MTPINPTRIKNDFPQLSIGTADKPFVYLDSAVTTQKPASVIEALTRFYETAHANVHRGVYPLAEKATEKYENTRARTAAFIGESNPANIVFTRGTTESINLVAHGWGRKYLKEGDEILLTDLEHHSNIVPWFMLAKEKKIRLKSAPVSAGGMLDMAAFKKALTPQVKLVAATGMSNVLGTFPPIREMARLAHANKSLILIDGAQLIPHEKVDVLSLDIDFLAFSAHKMLGPTGVGVLWAKSSHLDNMDPFLGGGEMINRVSLEEITWADVPQKFEAGTMNFAGVAAFSAALDYLENIGMEAVRAHEKEITEYALTRLLKLPQLTVYGPHDPAKQGGVLSFNHNIVHAHDVGTILGERGVALRVGHHCAQPLMKVLGVPSTVRASFYIYNSTEDVDQLVQSLVEVERVFELT